MILDPEVGAAAASDAYTNRPIDAPNMSTDVYLWWP